MPSTSTSSLPRRSTSSTSCGRPLTVTKYLTRLPRRARPRAAHAAEQAAGKGGGAVTSVMPGVVVQVLVEPGRAVAKGEPLLVLSAMKMQNEIGAPSDGVVREVHVAPGQTVAAGAKLVTLD